MRKIHIEFMMLNLLDKSLADREIVLSEDHHSKKLIEFC